MDRRAHRSRDTQRLPRSDTLRDIRGISPSRARRIVRVESRIFSRQELGFEADEADIMETPSPPKHAVRSDVPARKPLPASPTPAPSATMAPRHGATGSNASAASAGARNGPTGYSTPGQSATPGHAHGSAHLTSHSNAPRQAGHRPSNANNLAPPGPPTHGAPTSTSGHSATSGLHRTGNVSPSGRTGDDPSTPGYMTSTASRQAAKHTSSGTSAGTVKAAAAATPGVIGARPPTWQTNAKRVSRVKTEATLIEQKRANQEETIRNLDRMLTRTPPTLAEYDVKTPSGDAAPAPLRLSQNPLKISGRPAPYTDKDTTEADFADLPELEHTERDEVLEQLSDTFDNAMHIIQTKHKEISSKILTYVEALEQKVDGFEKMLKNMDANLCQRCCEEMGVVMTEDGADLYPEDEETQALEWYVNKQEASNPNWGKLGTPDQVKPVSAEFLKRLVFEKREFDAAAAAAGRK